VGLHFREWQIEQRRDGIVRTVPEGQVFGLEMTHRPLTAARPAHEQQRRPKPPVLVGVVVHKRRHRVGFAIGAPERRRTLVDTLVAAQGGVFAQRRRIDSLTTLPRMNPIFAGRSARRRMRYGYQ